MINPADINTPLALELLTDDLAATITSTFNTLVPLTISTIPSKQGPKSRVSPQLHSLNRQRDKAYKKSPGL